LRIFVGIVVRAAQSLFLRTRWRYFSLPVELFIEVIFQKHANTGRITALSMTRNRGAVSVGIVG
jgi:hypothetical protein